MNDALRTPHAPHPARARHGLRAGAFTAAALAVLLGACASTPPPMEQLAVGRASVERASSSAAAEAPVELAAARDKIARANVAMANKDYTLARQLAEQADADAALAEAQSRSVRSGRALNEVRASIDQLRTEMTRMPKAP